MVHRLGRLAIPRGPESILGFRRFGDRLTLNPCIPPEWKGFEITYQYRSATYQIAVENPQGQRTWNRHHFGRRPPR